MRRTGIAVYIVGAVALVAFGFIVFGTFRAPRVETVQHGYRGTGMDLVYHRAELALAKEDNGLPHFIPTATKTGVKAKDIYKNVQVLGDVDAAEFLRVMTSFATWVSPKNGGCTYCHGNNGNFASDALYTKRVARRMLQMTRTINADWQSHVQKVGVTCWTCHRGNPVPAYVWFNNPGTAQEMAVPSELAGDSSLPTDPLTPYLQQAKEIRVNATQALVGGPDHQSIKQTEGTYALMMHMSNALGVNCTYCHNTRAFYNWSQSTPQRVNAWYGIRMVREINGEYLGSLTSTFPAYRLGPHGDVAKVDCTTCHQGVFKPLLGASMIGTYPELTVTTDVASTDLDKKSTAPAAVAPEAPAPTPAPAPPSPAPQAATPPASAPTAEAIPQAAAPAPAPSEPSPNGPEPPKGADPSY